MVIVQDRGGQRLKLSPSAQPSAQKGEERREPAQRASRRDAFLLGAFLWRSKEKYLAPAGAKQRLNCAAAQNKSLMPFQLRQLPQNPQHQFLSGLAHALTQLVRIAFAGDQWADDAGEACHIAAGL